MVDLRPAVTFSRSTAALISKLRGILYYDSKCGFLNRILNATAKRKPDQAAPEITLDPLENIGGEEGPFFDFCFFFVLQRQQMLFILFLAEFFM